MEETLKKPKFKDYKLIITILICVGVFFLCTISLFATNFDVYMDDLPFHYNRIIGVADAIRSGRFPVKYYDNFFYGAGYFSPLFYGDLFLIFPALLVICGFTPLAAYYIFIYSIALVTAISMYFLLKTYVNNKYLCIIGATYFVLSSYIFTNMFFRGALGESLGIIFMIWLVFGIKNMLYHDFSKPWILTIAFLGMLFSHITTLVISGVMLVVVILFNAKKLLTKKSFYLKALLAFGLFLAIGCYFICSFVEMFFSDTFCISRPWTYTSHNTHSFIGLFTSPYGAGIVCLVPLVLRIILFKEKNLDDGDRAKLKTINTLLIIAYILTFLTLDIFPWKWLDNVLIFLQFPWRLFSISHILFAICITLELSIFIQREGYHVFVRILTICVSFYFLFFNNLFLIQIKTTLPDINSFAPIYEWYPVSIYNLADNETNEFILTKDVLDDKNNKVSFDKKQYDTEVTFISEEDSTYYIVPIIYYKGYEAVITLDDGTSHNLEVYENNCGYIEVKTNHEAGKIVVRYKGTTVQTVSLIVSTVATNAVIVFVVAKAIIKKKKQKNLQKIEQN